MDNKIKHELDTLKEIIANTVSVDQIWLFGSYAYGTPDKESDLDLYVVLKDDAEIKEYEAEVKILNAISIAKTKSVDIITNKKSKYLWLTTGPTMERKIAREGIKIYG